MALTVDLPSGLESALRRSISGDVDACMREALAVQLYRDRKLTHGQFQRFLGVGSCEADTVIKRHGGVDELTVDELAEQARTALDARQQH